MSGEFLGVGIDSSQHGTNSQEAQQILQSKRVGTVQQSIGTSHAIVLDSEEVRLHHCFIKRVLRMAPGATPPDYFADEPEFDDPEQFVVTAGTERTDELRRNTGRKDECPEPFEGPARQPLAIKDFLDLYGTHYAHATVYGAWGRNVTTYAAQSVSDLVAQSSEFEHSLKIGLQVPAPEGEPTKGGFSVGRTDGQAESGSRRQEAGSEVTTTGWYCVGGSGGSCEHGADRGSRLVPVFLDLRALDGLLGPPHFTDPRIIVDLRRKVQAAIIERLTQQAARNPLSDAPPFRHYELELDALSCSGSGSGSFGTASCQPLIDAADLLIYGRLANGAKVDLSPAQNYPLATFVTPASPPPGSPSPAAPPRSIVFVAGQRSSGSGIDQIALSVAPRRSQRDAGEPTADGCCGEVVLAPIGCSIKTDERRDCVAIGNQQSCGSDYPVYEDLPCPSRALAPGERVLAWALRPRDGEAAPRGVLGRTTGEVAIPYRKELVSTRFDTALLQMSLLGSQEVLSISGTLRSIDLSQQLGVPREPQGLAIAFEAPAPTTPLIFGPGDPHVYLRCPDGSRHTPAGCDGIDPATPCPVPLVRYGRSCVNPDEEVQLAFYNDGVYWASATLSYMLDGRKVEIAGRRLSKTEWQVFSAPRRAEGIALTLLFDEIIRKRPLLTAPAPAEQGPQCFFATGSAFAPQPDLDRTCRDFVRSTGHQLNGLPLR